MLQINVYNVNQIRDNQQFAFDNNILDINCEAFLRSLPNYQKIKAININIIKPNEHDFETNTILDIIPISTKVYGVLGQGQTNTLTQAYVLLTGADELKNQFKNFGSSEGILSQHIIYNQPGTITAQDWLIHIDVIVEQNQIDNYQTVIQVHQICDDFIQEIRAVLKKADIKDLTEKHLFEDIDLTSTKKRVVLVKQLGGSGVMHDTIVGPDQPSGVSGGESMINLKNTPVVLSPNEYRDGALRALT